MTADPELVALIRQEVPDQEHRRLFDQRADRFPRPDRHPDPPDRRLARARSASSPRSPTTPFHEHPHKATGLIPFPDPHSCARAISRLANGGVQSTTGVTAAEYIERRALGTVEHLPVMQPYRALLHRNLAGGADRRLGARRRRSSRPRSTRPSRSSREEGATHIDFRPGDATARHALWDMRKGFFASGGARAAQGHGDADRGRRGADRPARRFRHRHAQAARRARLRGRDAFSATRWRATSTSR